MTRSERLAKEGKIEVYCGTLEIARLLSDKEFTKASPALRYIGTDDDAKYNGRNVSANVYEDEDGRLFAVIGYYYN